MKTRRFQPGDGPGIERLNTRLRARGVSWPVYPEGPRETATEGPVSSRLYVAEADGEVHGAVWLREHDFLVDGEVVHAGWAKYPVVESLIDPAFRGVPAALVFRLLREQPRLMALGMGGHGGPFAQLLRGMRWKGTAIPFYVRPVRPNRVLRHLKPLRRSPLRGAALDLAATTGLGWLGWQVFDRLRALGRRQGTHGLDVAPVPMFGTWADDLWHRTRDAYRFVARRDAVMLNLVFPDDPRLIRLRVRRGTSDIGWACVVVRDLTTDPGSALGPLRVGMVADGLALPGDADAVVAAATRFLTDADVDLIVSNQAHDAWRRALRGQGFVEVPSQFAFYWSPVMGKVLEPLADGGGLHVNRGDCDGPLFG